MKKTAIIVTTALALTLGLTGCKEEKKVTTQTQVSDFVANEENCNIEKLFTSKEDKETRIKKETICGNYWLKTDGTPWK